VIENIVKGEGMRKAIVVLMAVIVLALSLGAFAFQNEPEGFRDLKWGDPPTEDMIEFGKDANKWRRTYTKLEERLYLDNVRLDYIYYDFLITSEKDPQFFFVLLRFRDANKFYSLEEICENRFGLPTHKKTWENNDESRMWSSETTIIILDMDKFGGILSIERKPLSEEYRNLLVSADSD